jgi:uncharacterized protein YndB with AHSA1/START domain
MTDATLLGDHGRPAIRLERYLSDPPNVVWQALTQPEQLRAWFPCEVTLSGGPWEVGAGIIFEFPAQMSLTYTGRVLEINEPSSLAFTWGPSTLRFQLSAEGGGTRLVLTDELPPDAAARNAAGWERCLDRLVGIEPAADGWRPLFEQYAASFEPALGPQEAQPT